MDIVTLEVAAGAVIIATLAPLYILYLDRIRDAIVQRNGKTGP